MKAKKQKMVMVLLSLTLLGGIVGPHIMRNSVNSPSDNKNVILSAVVPGLTLPENKFPADKRSPLTLSPSFNAYAESTNFAEGTESLRVNILTSLLHIADDLQIDDKAKQSIASMIEQSLLEEQTREGLAKSLAEQLTDDEIEILSEYYNNPVNQKVRSREESLMKQDSETIAKFLEQFHDPEAFKHVQADSRKLIEELQLWQDTERLFRSITHQLLAGLNQNQNTVSPKLFEQAANAILESQREALVYSVMYLYQDLNPTELAEFKAIYKNPATVKERLIVFKYFENSLGQIGSAMGRLASLSESIK